LSKSPSSASAKPIPEQKVNKQLWRDIQEKAAASESEKLDAVRLLFDRPDELPRQSTRLIQRLASTDQPVAVRRAIASKLRESQDLSHSLALSILEILRNDPDPEVKSAAEEVYKSTAHEIYKIMQPIAEISRSLQATFQSIKIAQLDLSNLVANIPQVHLPNLQEILAATNLSTRALIDPVILSRQALESIARSAQAALPSYYPLPELEVIGRIYPEFKGGHATRLRSKLAKCVPGKLSWKVYQDICREILSYALVPPLLEPSEETATRGRAQRRDLIFHIPYDAGRFWESIRIAHKSLALIVECKNYSDLLRPDQVTITSKYFGEKKLGLFGVIVSRKGLSESAKQEQMRLWMEEEKMILCLTDGDMINMMSLKEADDDPSKVIDNAIRLFRQSI
jgi:hypothetical protein